MPLLKTFSFFFSSRRRHTRLTCDWSSDVCSSDLTAPAPCRAPQSGRRCWWPPRGRSPPAPTGGAHPAGASRAGAPPRRPRARGRGVLGPRTHHEVLGGARGARQFQVARLDAGEQQRGRGLVHRVDVEQPVRLCHKRAQRGGAAALLGIGCVDAPVQPLAVEVFVGEARGIVVARVKPVERIEVAERQRERALLRPHARFEQALQGPGAAQLVAMHQRADHHVAAGFARVEMPDAFGAGVANAPGGDVGRGQLEGQRWNGRVLGGGAAAHSSILANSTIFLYLATSAARNWKILTVVAATVEPLASIFFLKSGDCRVSFSAFFTLSNTGLGRLARAGMSGVAAERLASVVPRAITLPLLMCGRPLESTNTPYSRLLPMRSLVSGATPR